MVGRQPLKWCHEASSHPRQLELDLAGNVEPHRGLSCRTGEGAGVFTLQLSVDG